MSRLRVKAQASASRRRWTGSVLRSWRRVWYAVCSDRRRGEAGGDSPRASLPRRQREHHERMNRELGGFRDQTHRWRLTGARSCGPRNAPCTIAARFADAACAASSSLSPRRSIVALLTRRHEHDGAPAMEPSYGWCASWSRHRTVRHEPCRVRHPAGRRGGVWRHGLLSRPLRRGEGSICCFFEQGAPCGVGCCSGGIVLARFDPDRLTGPVDSTARARFW